MNRALCSLLTGGLAGPVAAHHSNDYHFDPDVAVTVVGTVSAFRFINPHARLMIDVTSENGEIVTWDCEMAGANSLTRRGWTQGVFRPGDRIVVEGIAARRHPTQCYFGTAQLSDGRRIALRDTFGNDATASPQQAVAPTALAEDVPNFNGVWRWAPPPDYSGAPPLGSPNRLAWVPRTFDRLVPGVDTGDRNDRLSGWRDSSASRPAKQPSTSYGRALDARRVRRRLRDSDDFRGPALFPGSAHRESFFRRNRSDTATLQLYALVVCT